MSKLYSSWCESMGQVEFPEWRGERHYMLLVSLATRVPKELSRYESLIVQMLEQARVSRTRQAFVMVDEGIVEPETTHRRAGLHADGYWNATRCVHSPGRHGWQPPTPPSPHGPRPEPEEEPSSQFLLLAASHRAARALVGSYRRNFRADFRGGDCSLLDTYRLESRPLDAKTVYKLGVFTLHESLPVAEPLRRTLIRIHVDRPERSS